MEEVACTIKCEENNINVSFVLFANIRLYEVFFVFFVLVSMIFFLNSAGIIIFLISFLLYLFDK